MSKTVIAVFDSIGRARQAVQALSDTGVVSERIQVQTGEEFLARAQQPAGTRAGAQSAVERFFADLGVDPQTASGEAGRPLSADDAVIVLEATDDRAEEAAGVLDRSGAINMDERARGAQPTAAATGRPLREQVDMYEDVDERALVARAPGERTGGRAHRARIYPGS